MNLVKGFFDQSEMASYKFEPEPPEALKCLICLEVAEEPWQHGECGRLFCEKCLEKHGKKKPCPNCRTHQPQYFRDGKSKREIQGLLVRCDNVERKCQWVGTVGTLQKHVDTCKFALVPCPKECKDDDGKIKSFMRKDLDEHVEKACPNRDYICEHCGEKSKYGDNHDEVCPKKIVPCPNSECTDIMQRQDVREHVATECEYTRTPCKYRRLGCDTELKRKDMAAHEEDDKLHLHMAIDKTVELERKLETISEMLKFGEPIKFKLTDYQRRKDNSDIVDSPAHYIFPKGYNMRLSVDVNGEEDEDDAGTHISVYACVCKGTYDSELKWPLVGKVTITLLNQLEDKKHYKRTFAMTSEENMRSAGGNTSWGYPQFIPHSELGHDLVKKTQYLKDDTLYFRMLVEATDYKSWLES